MTGFVGTGQVDEPQGPLDLTTAKFFLWCYITRAVLGCNGPVPSSINLCSISIQQLKQLTFEIGLQSVTDWISVISCEYLLTETYQVDLGFQVFSPKYG